jgi:hypothetical protein
LDHGKESLDSAKGDDQMSEYWLLKNSAHEAINEIKFHTSSVFTKLLYDWLLYG